ncbi:MAG TPA: hypothetical protein VFZ47_06980, partial [Chitinophagaceae bacterium]
MNSFYSKVKRNICATLTSKSGTLLMAVALILQVPASAQTTGLTFTDHTLHSGTAGANGAVYRFANAAPGIDVLVEIKSRSGSNVVLKDIDLTTCGLNTSFQPQLERSGNVVGIDEWWMEFEFRFVKAGTQLDANLQKLAITALDVDGDGLTVEEYVEFYKAKSCSLASPSNIQAIPLNGNNETGTGDKNYRFEGELPRTAGIDIVNTAIMGYAKYENMNRIKVRIGGESLGLGIATET